MASRISYFFCALVMVYTSLVFYPKWQQTSTEATISWDASGYYWYLPSVFIYHDLKHQGFKDSILRQYNPTPYPDFQQAFWHQDAGVYVMKYSSGMAVMEAPFFAAGHLAAKATGAPRDGFSWPYQFFIQLGGLLVGLLGLWAFRRFLLFYYPDGVVAAVLLLLVLATNYLNYAAIDAGMSHSWLFTIYAFLLLATRRFHERPGAGRAAAVGLLVGLATLTRPTELISCMISVLWGMESLSPKALAGRWRFLLAHWHPALLALGCAAAIIFIQPFYWHWATGEWIVYSYQDQGFSFLHPHFKDYTFSPVTGWLSYTPLMVLAFVGLVPLLRHGKNRVAVAVFVLINYYIVASWDVWQFGGRAMVQSYAVMMIPMAALVDWCARRAWAKGLLAGIAVLFAYYNIWYTANAHNGHYWPGKPIGNQSLLDGEAGSWRYLLRTAGRWHVSSEVMKLREVDEIFEGPVAARQLIADTSFSGPGLWLFKDSVQEAGIGRRIAVQPGQWLRGSAVLNMPQKEWNFWSMPLLKASLWRQGKPAREQWIHLGRYMEEGKQKTVYIDIRTKDAAGADSVSVLVWSGSTALPIGVAGLRIEQLTPAGD